MTYSQKRNWGYDENGEWNSVQGQELPDGWTHDDPNAKKEDAVAPKPVTVEVPERKKPGPKPKNKSED